MNKYVIIEKALSDILKCIKDFDKYSYPVCDEKGMADYGEEAYFVESHWYANAVVKAKKLRKSEEKDKFFTYGNNLLKAICFYFNVSIEEMRGSSRKLRYTRIREMFCYLAQRKGLSIVLLGNLLLRDHSTIINSIKRCEDDIKTDKNFKKELEKVRKCLENVKY